jgi:hypothetical protein
MDGRVRKNRPEASSGFGHVSPCELRNFPPGNIVSKLKSVCSSPHNSQAATCSSFNGRYRNARKTCGAPCTSLVNVAVSSRL